MILMWQKIIQGGNKKSPQVNNIIQAVLDPLQMLLNDKQKSKW